MEKKTVIIVIVVLLLVIVIIGVALGLLFTGSPTIKLEVWPHDDSDPPLIKYRVNDAGTWMTWNTRLEEFLKEYKRGTQQTSLLFQQAEPDTSGVKRLACNEGGKVLGDKEVCDVSLDNYFPCNRYTFDSDSVCLFFRLNKVRNWRPDIFYQTEELPKNMPDELKNHIAAIRHSPDQNNNVWLSCEGENPADREYIGPLQYLPRRGFPIYYFPYTNKEGYLSPLVAVYFEKPKKGVLINVVCTAWAKNIDNNATQGIVHFSLMIDT